ncbi:ABC transporter ATP-binding protein [Abyssalbus ytuae]|uniref:ABC transporter ATP-binding protein/permease n=1 Tax=Abyssalbus ytuae TaxID=2926907 RepID=A0A9E6ZME6_9FLAO|nr:ABC transporter ATP-binding protein [Abyssalbus ytuae]UOB16985.1 ABC transporter ATP-binding protein/permease [Abyssalbus ytuae]
MKELKYLNRFFKKYKLRLLLGVIITIIARVFSLVLPPYVNKSITAVEDYFLSGNSNVSELKTQLISYIIIIVGAALLSAFFTFLMRQTIINVSRYIEYDLKNEIYSHYQKLPLDFYKQNRTGDLMNRISEDVSQVRMYAGPAIMYSIQTLTLFICVIPIMIYKSPYMSLYALLPLPILSFLIYKISKIIHSRSTIVQQYLSALSTFTQEAFSGISVIKAYSLENDINKDIEALATEGKNKSMNLAKVNSWFFPLMILLIGLSSLLAIYAGGKQYINGEIESTGLILEFILYILMLTWPVATVGWVTSIVQRAEASQKRLNEFLNVEPAIINTVTKETPIKGEVEFKNVTFTYDDTNITALKNISFKVNAGETVAIIGKTGSGKSTILNLISRMYDIDSGEILLDGVRIKDLNLNNIRKAIGAVPQDAFLFSSTLEENIKFGKTEASDDEMIKAAQKASIHDSIMGFTHKYKTVLGERGITLSGGQQQRVSIARAIIKDPKIYLFDDCLSAVDTETEEKILTNLSEVSKEKTTILVSHRISSAKNANKIFVIDEGKIIQQGTHNQLISKDGYYKELYLNQLSEKEN